MDDDLREVVRREHLLLDPSLRADAATVRALIHPEFVEFGKSGRVWDGESLRAALADDPAVPGPATDIDAVHLAEDVVLLTYRIDGPEGSLRSSVWIRDPGDGAGWRLRFHQGTPTPPTGRGPLVDTRTG